MNFSNNSISNLKKLVNPKKFGKILIISGKKSYFASGANKLIKQVLIDKETYLFLKKNKIPEIKELEKIISYLRFIKPDLIIAIGGGSVIDYAKIANTLHPEKNLKKQIINSDYGKIKKIAKLLAIPTTAGTGAEVTANAVIYIDKIKFSVEGDFLIPNYFIIIPELILKAKKILKASSGFDAISQAIESIISKKSTDESVEFALKSLKISLKYYLEHLRNPTITNSYKMCLAANYSGKAISISKTTAPHALSYPFTAHYGISHGHAVSLTLNDFLIFNFKSIKHSNCKFDLKKRYIQIFNVANISNINDFNFFINNIKKKAGLENNFSKLGINIKKALPKILEEVNDQRLSNNPIDITKNDIKNILLKK
jgi:alcohol dehydrogenase class IV|tara:strand:- start:47 stop:1156 length:1110 start_codon:yes stop_codon:yes gene_type:complete